MHCVHSYSYSIFIVLTGLIAIGFYNPLQAVASVPAYFKSYSTKQPPFTSVLKEASRPCRGETMPAYRVMDNKGKILPNAKEPDVSIQTRAHTRANTYK